MNKICYKKKKNLESNFSVNELTCALFNFVENKS